MKAIISWWQQLNDRDQRLLFWGGLIALVLLAYAFIWQPLSQGAVNARQQYIAEQRLLVWMQRSEKVLARLGTGQHKRQSINKSQALSLIRQSLKQQGLDEYLKQSEQGESGDIQLTFKLVPFDGMMTWLADLQRRYTITVKKATVQSKPTPGIVAMELVLRLQ